MSTTGSSSPSSRPKPSNGGTIRYEQAPAEREPKTLGGSCYVREKSASGANNVKLPPQVSRAPRVVWRERARLCCRHTRREVERRSASVVRLSKFGRRWWRARSESSTRAASTPGPRTTMSRSARVWATRCAVITERTQVNKETAFSYGEYRCLLDLFSTPEGLHPRLTQLPRVRNVYGSCDG